MSGPELLVIEGKPRPVGSFAVARVLPSMRLRALGPFVFLDHMGPMTLAPGQGFDVAPHPHVGLSTVTYLFAGQVLHRDSLGSAQAIEPGALNVMTAGRGITHSERAPAAFRASGGPLHGVQLWLALPSADEQGEPSFAHAGAAALPEARADGLTSRTVFGPGAPIAHPSRPLLVDVALAPGARLEATREDEPRGVFVASGSVTVGGALHAADRLLVLPRGARVDVIASGDARVLVLGGPELDGPRFIDWNFVSSSKDVLERAKDDWRAGRFPRVVGDDGAPIPYPPSR